MRSTTVAGRSCVLRAFVSFLLATIPAGSAAQEARAADPASHPPRRPPPSAPQRPRAEGPGHFVDAGRGSDERDGTEAAPWKTINHALKKLSPGDTLYLRGGTYYENVYCAVAGRPDAPVTIRSFPGERAVIDGGLPEFHDGPAEAWVPAPGGAAGEFRSAKPYKNIRDVVGMFGDSFIGLQTYWHAADLRADNELFIAENNEVWKPVYCGPGLWYDRQSGFIHARLAHTHVDAPSIENYAGETDPRKLPLIIAPFRSVPLLVDQAMHVRFQDLVIRGGGYRTVVLDFGIDLHFDNVTVYAGTYGIWAKSTGPLTMTDCGVYGMMAPWAFRDENALYTFTPNRYDPFIPAPGAGRNIARLPTHALVVTEGSAEYDVFFYPYNHDWDISRCEFADGHDGVYLSGRHIRFHHNLVDDIQDDAIYLSSPTPAISDDIHIYQNLIRQCVTPFGAHGRGGPGGELFVYRNVIDLRKPLRFNRPTPQKPNGSDLRGSLSFQTHDSGNILHMEKMNFYHNTFLGRANTDAPLWGQGTLHGGDPRQARRVLNNIFVYQGDIASYPALQWDPAATEADVQVDGNLHWNPHPGAKASPNLFDAVRELPVSKRNAERYGGPWEANGVAGDPQFMAFSSDPQAVNDYRLRPGGPAAGKGVPLPEAWADPERPPGGARPDIGALPVGCEPLKVGIQGQHTAGM